MSAEIPEAPKKEMVQQIIKFADGTETVINYRHIAEPMEEQEQAAEAAPEVPADPVVEPEAEEAGE